MFFPYFKHHLYTLTIMFLVGCLTGCGGGGGGKNDVTTTTTTSTTTTTTQPTAGAKWTYMVYIAGDNTLSDAAVADLREMALIGSNSSVNIVVQGELSPSRTDGAPAETQRGRVTVGMPDSDFAAITNVDMGNKTTLTNFIKWAKTSYPAENYALVLWSHGAGWKVQGLSRSNTKGALQDETSGTFMSMNDIASAVRDSGVHFGLINFDACLMAMYEIGYALRSDADYLVASEEVSPGEGDDYTAILGALKAKPAMTPRELAIKTVEVYKSFYETQGRSSVTKSVIDLSKIGSIKTAVDGLGKALTDKIGTLRPKIQTAQEGTVNYEYIFNRDLADFVAKLKPLTTDSTVLAAITSVETALTAAIVSNQIYSPDPSKPLKRSKGMAIYLPMKSEIMANDLATYATLDSSKDGTSPSAWAGFINLMVSGNVSDPYVQSAPGNFAFYIEWDNPNVDLDMYIYEPANLVAPYMGSVSMNGDMSGDSADTGVQAEYYAAWPTVEAGDYDIFINYYDGTGSTNVSLYYYDGGPGTFKKYGPWTLKNSSKPDAPAGLYPDQDLSTYEAFLVDTYGNWKYPLTHRAVASGRAAFSSTKIMNAGNKSRIQIAGRRLQIKSGKTGREVWHKVSR